MSPYRKAAEQCEPYEDGVFPNPMVNEHFNICPGDLICLNCGGYTTTKYHCLKNQWECKCGAVFTLAQIIYLGFPRLRWKPCDKCNYWKNNKG